MTKTPRIGFFLYQGVSCLEIPESGLGFQPSDPKGRCWGSVSPVLGLLPSPFSDLLLNERLHGCAGSSTWCGRPPTPNQPIIASRARNDHRPLRAALCGVLTRRAHLPMVGGPAVGGTRVDRTYQHHPVWVSWLNISKQCSLVHTHWEEVLLWETQIMGVWRPTASRSPHRPGFAAPGFSAQVNLHLPRIVDSLHPLLAAPRSELRPVSCPELRWQKEPSSVVSGDL